MTMEDKLLLMTVKVMIDTFGGMTVPEGMILVTMVIKITRRRRSLVMMMMRGRRRRKRRKQVMMKTKTDFQLSIFFRISNHLFH